MVLIVLINNTLKNKNKNLKFERGLIFMINNINNKNMELMEELNETYKDIFENYEALAKEYEEIEEEGTIFKVDNFIIRSLEYIPFEEMEIGELIANCESMEECERELINLMHDVVDFITPIYNHEIEEIFDSMENYEIDEIMEQISDWFELSNGIIEFRETIVTEHIYKKVFAECLYIIDNIQKVSIY